MPFRSWRVIPEIERDALAATTLAPTSEVSKNDVNVASARVAVAVTNSPAVSVAVNVVLITATPVASVATWANPR